MINEGPKGPPICCCQWTLDHQKERRIGSAHSAVRVLRFWSSLFRGYLMLEFTVQMVEYLHLCLLEPISPIRLWKYRKGTNTLCPVIDDLPPHGTLWKTWEVLGLGPELLWYQTPCCVTGENKLGFTIQLRLKNWIKVQLHWSRLFDWNWYATARHGVSWNQMVTWCHSRPKFAQKTYFFAMLWSLDR